MDLLFKTVNDIVDFLPVTESFSFEKIKPYLSMVQKDVLKRILGKDQLDALITAYQEDSMSEEQEALLEECRVPLANLAFYEGVDVLSIQIGSLGAYTAEDGESKPASNSQIYYLKKSVKTLGFKGIENLLDFLEDNIADYPLWSDSSEYTAIKSLFVTTANDYSENFNRRISRWVYWNITPIMKQVQKDLCENLLSKEFYELLLDEHKDNDLSSENTKLVDLIKPALCYATFVKGLEQLAVSIDDEGVTLFSQENLRNLSEIKKNADAQRIESLKLSAQKEVGKFMGQLADLLNSNLDDYPLYRDNVYSPDSASEYENDAENSFYYL